MEKKFYVYVHRRATDGTVFYVGKGKGGRAQSTKWRNQHWKNIVAKHGFTPDIIARFSNETCAFSFEIAMIKAYGRENLCNMTDGGEGMSGWIASEETRKKCSAWQVGRKLTEDHKSKISKSGLGIKKSDSFKIVVSEMKTGSRHHFWGIKGMDSPFSHKQNYRFVNESGEDVLMAKCEFASKYGLSRSKVSAIVLGRRKSHKGWHHAPD